MECLQANLLLEGRRAVLTYDGPKLTPIDLRSFVRRAHYIKNKNCMTYYCRRTGLFPV